MLFSFNRVNHLSAADYLFDMVTRLRCTNLRQITVFKISIIDTPCKRMLLVEGKLIPPWTTELQRVWHEASHDLEQRKLAIDLSNVTVISSEGENTLFELMKDGAKFTCGGVLTKYVLKRLARRSRSRFRDILMTVTGESEA